MFHIFTGCYCLLTSWTVITPSGQQVNKCLESGEYLISVTAASCCLNSAKTHVLSISNTRNVPEEKPDDTNKPLGCNVTQIGVSSMDKNSYACS